MQTGSGTQELGGGFRYHGVATPVSNHRGTVATVDAAGRDILLVWLFDHRGGYALLLIDAETGASEEFTTPFAPGGDCPYASLLSRANRYYTQFNSHFVEFDPLQRAFTFCHSTTPQMAMGMAEDDCGRVFAVSYPDSGVVGYDPATGWWQDYGSVYPQNWRQYQRYVAADDQGWLYFAVGSTASQIVALEVVSGQARPVLGELERGRGTSLVYRDLDGCVYGQPLAGQPGPWLRLRAGAWDWVPAAPEQPVATITGSQSLCHGRFASGRQLVECDLVERCLVTNGPGSAGQRRLRFDYSSDGAHLMGVALAPDGTLAGGTAFPMRFFAYDPVGDQWRNQASYGQWNTVARHCDRFFVGGYGAGFLLEWNPSEPWVPTAVGDENSNPRFLAQCEPDINRPHCLLAHPDGRLLVLAGTPGYGYTGGGLLFWDRQTQTATRVGHADLLPEHSTMSLVAWGDGLLLGGTTTAPGTGGEKRADVAEMYLLDLATRTITWHAPVIAGAQEYTCLLARPNGLVYGVVDRRQFIVFDPAGTALVHTEPIEPRFGLTATQQGPRILVEGDDDVVYLLCVRGIARIDPVAHRITWMADAPVPIGPGGDYHQGRIYFGSESRLYSYAVAAASN